MKRVLVFAMLLAARVNAGVVLEASTDSLELVTSSAASTDYNCSWADNTTTAFTPGKSAGNVASATTTTVVSAPAASTQRTILNCTFRNVGAVANTLGIQRDVSATNRSMWSGTIGAGETLAMDQNGAFTIYAATGVPRSQASDITGYNGKAYGYQKAGTAKDAAGYWYWFGKDAGFPGASVFGTPGLNGAVTDCSTAAGATIMGAHLLQDPATGALYLTSIQIAGTQAELYQLVDIAWFNTGATVTTTTLQAITSGALPARDINGSTDGEGYEMALLTTTANTNAAVITNTTVNYTDSAGNTGNVATFSALVGWQAPATPVIGTWMPFQLAAGDRGVRAITNASGGGLTLGTSYVTGTLSLVIYRPLAVIPNPVANVGGIGNMAYFQAPGLRIYNDSCLVLLAVGSASASNPAGVYTIMER